MDIFLVALTWPLLILVIGFVMIAIYDSLGAVHAIGGLIWPIIIIAIIIAMVKSRRKTATGVKTDLDEMRKWAVMISLASLVPLFVRYLIIAADRDLAALIFGLLIGFAVLVWGTFVKNNSTVSKANLLGGGIAIIYTYWQIWGLGLGPRVIVAAIGLIIAVALASIKLKNKLL